MTFRQLAENYLFSRWGKDICYESDVVALEALMEMASEVGEEREKLKNDWMSAEPTKEYDCADEVTS